MKRFLITRNLFDGDTYRFKKEAETKQEAIDWALTKPHLGSYVSYTVMEKDAQDFEISMSDSFEMIEVSEDVYEKQLNIPAQFTIDDGVEVGSTDEEKVAALEVEAKPNLAKVQLGMKIVALIGARNEANPNVGSDEIVSFFANPNIDIIIRLLHVGSISTAKAKIQALTPDGSIIRQEDIDDIILMISKAGF